MALRIPSAAMKTTPTINVMRAAKNMSAVSGAMMLGDALCQALETFDSDRKFSWDHARTMRMGITGAFLVTPASFSWNMYAERIAPGTSFRAVVTKLGVSIAVLPPMLAAQFTSLTLLEKGKTGDDVYRKLSRDFMPTLKNAVLFWPMVSVVNSVFVPVLSRPIFSSFAGVFWNVYISYQANHNGMDIGEVSVVYPQVEDQEGVLSKVGVEKATAEMAVAAAIGAPAVAVDSDVEGAGVARISAEGTAVVVREGNSETATSSGEVGDAAAAPATAPSTATATATADTPARKRRGKFVRRTSVVSM